MTALAALVHTDERGGKGPGKGLGSTAQFTCRLDGLRAVVPDLTWTVDELRAAYDLRSGLAHGTGVSAAALTGEARRLYLLVQNGLRAILKACIRDPAVAARFATDDDMRRLG